MRMHEYEWWLCGVCLHVARSDTWGTSGGNNDTAVCPGCGYVHRDYENTWVDAGDEMAMRRKARAEAAERVHVE